MCVGDAPAFICWADHPLPATLCRSKGCCATCYAMHSSLLLLPPLSLCGSAEQQAHLRPAACHPTLAAACRRRGRPAEKQSRQCTSARQKQQSCGGAGQPPLVHVVVHLQTDRMQWCAAESQTGCTVAPRQCPWHPCPARDTLQTTSYKTHKLQLSGSKRTSSCTSPLMSIASTLSQAQGMRGNVTSNCKWAASAAAAAAAL